MKLLKERWQVSMKQKSPQSKKILGGIPAAYFSSQSFSVVDDFLLERMKQRRIIKCKKDVL